MNAPAPPSDGELSLLLAAEQAVEHGAELLRRGRRHVGALTAKGDRDFATAVDLQIERAIRRQLELMTPGIPMLGEEEGGARGGGARWVLDPIDGTINYAHDSPLCAISLALVDERGSRLGIVDLPVLGERYVSLAGRGAYRNRVPLCVAPIERLRDAVVGLADFAVGPGAEEENRVHVGIVRQLAGKSLRIRAHGSAALDLAWLAAGRLGATVMLSNLPWDVGAGVLVAREAGAAVYDQDGSPYGPDSRFTIASAPSLREAMLTVVRNALDEEAPCRG